jgi:tetratricopeptide (TPR) repeat protein
MQTVPTPATLLALAAVTAVGISLPITFAQTATPPEAISAPSAEEISKQIAALGSDDFREREAATTEVWKLGRAAEAVLREAILTGNFELRYRGKKILDEFDLGLYPDTPKETRALVQRFRKGDAASRQMAVQELAKQGKTDLLIKLVKRERDPAMRNTVAALIAQNVSTMAPKHIFDSELQKAEDLLQLAALSSRGMRDYTTFLLTTGKLDAAIADQRGRADETRVDTELLAWMLRVKGQNTEAAKIFASIGDTARARDARASGGDMLAYAESFTDPSRRTADSLAYAAAAARISGDEEKLETTIKDIVDYAMVMPDEADRCMNALILNGSPEKAFQLAADLKDGSLLEMEVWRYDFDSAFEIMGVKADDAPFDAWLEKFAKEFKVRNEQEIQGAILPAGRLASVCALTGQKDASAKIFRNVARLLEAENASILPLVQWELLVGLHKLAREHAVKAMELEIEGDVISSLFPVRADYAWLTTSTWEYLRTEYPDESNDASLGRMFALFGADLTIAANNPPAATIAAIHEKAREADGVERKELLRMVVDLARLHDQWAIAADAMESWLPMLGNEVAAFHHIRFGEALLKSSQPAKAAEQYEKAWQFETSNPLPLYLKGVALAAAGDETAAELKSKASLMAIGNVTKRHFLANAMWQNGDDEAARQQDQLILRIASPREGVHPEALRRISAATRLSGSAADAAHALEFYLLSMMRPVNQGSVVSPRGALSYYVNLGVLQSRAKFDAGQPAAAAAKIAELQKLNSSDSSMLEDMHQLLTDAGLATEADALFETTYKISKSTVDRFPGRGQHHNNHAWLLSRCAKKLDEALTHGKKAVEMEPGNGAFLDTLAEAHFQRGEQELAVAASEKAVELLGGDTQVKRQLERFKTGKPSDR